MGTLRQRVVTVGGASLLFVLMSSVAVFAVVGVKHTIAIQPYIGVVAAVLVPDALSTWWLFRRIQKDRPRSDARRAATAFAVCVPVTLAITYVLGELVGGYAEVILGSRFITPTLVVFISVLMVVIPSAIVGWVFHPPAAGLPFVEIDQNEHR